MSDNQRRKVASATDPTGRSERITNLDFVRGVATLGILLMNIVSFGLPAPAYFNVSIGSETWADTVVGRLGEVFVDQKMMALFSMLFGAGIVLFADRAAAKGARAVWLSLWRNLLLAGIGLVHSFFWVGDVLLLYACCSPVVLFVRRWKPRSLLILGTVVVLSSAVASFAVAPWVDADGANLGDMWLLGTPDLPTVMSDGMGLWLIWDFVARGLGLMIIGVALYRMGVLSATGDATEDQRRVAWGFGLGLPFAVGAVALMVVDDFAPRSATIVQGLNTLATIPVGIGLLGLITLWGRRDETWLHRRLQAVGRMALTNYLTQTVLGLVVLRLVFERGELGRAWLLLVVGAIWALQLAWSAPWLARFRFGPFEWLWRLATYRRWQPMTSS